MPFHQEWFVPNRIVKVTFSGNLTPEEIGKSFTVSGKFLLESDAERVHFIHDWSQLENFPTNISLIRNAVNVGDTPSRSKLGWVVIFGARQPLLRFVGDLVFQLFRIRTHMTDNFATALEFLYQQDLTLKKQNNFTDVRWYLKGHILYCQDVFNAEEMTRRNTNALNLLESEGKPPYVHMLIDFASTNTADFDADVRELVRRSTSSKAFADARDKLVRHPLFGWVVVFNIHDRNINAGGKIVAMQYNYKRKEVDSLPEAINFLKQVDPNIASIFSTQSDDKS